MNEQKLKELMALAQLSQALEGPQRQQEQQQLAVALQLLDADAKQRSATESQALEREKMVAAQGLSERELAQRDRLATRQADLDERKLTVGNKQQFIDTLSRDQNISLKAKLAAIAQLDPEMAPAVEALHVGQRDEAVSKLAPTIRSLYEANKGDVPELNEALAAVRATTPNSEQFDYQDWEGLNAMLPAQTRGVVKLPAAKPVFRDRAVGETADPLGLFLSRFPQWVRETGGDFGTTNPAALKRMAEKNPR